MQAPFLLFLGMEFNTLKDIPNLHQIKLVANQLQNVVIETPLQFSSELSSRFGANIYLKREDLQVVRSYKIRGAYHKIANLPIELRNRGVVAASAGNHAQGVAFACASLKIRATIFMPKTTPMQKLDAVRLFGKSFVRIKLVGQTYDEAFVASRKFCDQQACVYIPPFDDYDIIAGQATVALEMYKQCKQTIDYVFVPFGGGGLAAGSALVTKYISPSTKIIALEPELAASFSKSIEKGEVVELETIDPFVDGASVKKIGRLPFEICKNQINAVQLINKKHLCRTMLDLYQFESLLTEPAGALSVAGLEAFAQEIKGKTIVCIISGGNFDSKRFPEINIIATS
ncbi:MAG: threonine ammonia-lyase [Bacteroidota bacterium]|jgi:threonine dehydratase